MSIGVGMAGGLPALYTEIPCAMHAADAVLKYEGSSPLALKGGIKVRVEANISGGLGGVKLKTIGYEVSADHDVLGKVTISQADVDTTPLGTLEVIKTLPPTFKNALIIDVTLTIEKSRDGGPITLIGVKPLTLVCDPLTVFPPQGSVYQLAAPVGFVRQGEPNTVLATLDKAPFTVSHNP